MQNVVFVILLTIWSFSSFSTTWETNKDHSVIMFQVPYMGISEVTGRFNEFKGKIDFNDDGKVIESLYVKIISSSIDTGNKMRDGHLKGNDFFQSTKHPYIEFQSQKLTQIARDHFSAQGLLSMKGVKKLVAIEFSLSALTKDTWNYETRFVKFKSSLNRKDFNLLWNKTLDHQEFLLGDVIDFWGSFQIQKITHKTPSSKHMIPDTKYIRSREILARRGLEQSTAKFIPLDSVSVKKLKKSISPVPDIKLKPTICSVDIRESVWWWISLCVVGLFGFFSVIIISFYSKNILLEYFPRNYEENGLLGYLSDFVVIIYVILYSVALWFLGWGVR